MTSWELEEKLKKYKLTFSIGFGIVGVLVGIFLLFVFVLKSIFGIVFLIPITMLFLSAYDTWKKYKETKQELDELYQEAARNFMNSAWRDTYNRFRYGEAWWQEEKKRREKEEGQRQQQQQNQWQWTNSNTATKNYYDPVKEAYKFFGLAYNTGVIEVRRTYRKLALRYHPDHGGSAEKFNLLMQHKEVLFKYLGIK